MANNFFSVQIIFSDNFLFSVQAKYNGICLSSFNLMLAYSAMSWNSSTARGTWWETIATEHEIKIELPT